MVHPILIQRLVSRFQVFPWPYRFTLLTLNLILSLFILWTCLNTCFTLFFFLKIEFPILKIPLLYNQIEYSFIIVVVRNFFFSLIDCWVNFSMCIGIPVAWLLFRGRGPRGILAFVGSFNFAVITSCVKILIEVFQNLQFVFSLQMGMGMLLICCCRIQFGWFVAGFVFVLLGLWILVFNFEILRS